MNLLDAALLEVPKPTSRAASDINDGLRTHQVDHERNNDPSGLIGPILVALVELPAVEGCHGHGRRTDLLVNPFGLVSRTGNAGVAVQFRHTRPAKPVTSLAVGRAC